MKHFRGRGTDNPGAMEAGCGIGNRKLWVQTETGVSELPEGLLKQYGLVLR